MYDEKDIQAIVVDRAKHFEPKSLQNFHANKAKALAKQGQINQLLLDDDVSDWLIHQNTATKRRINEMIRQVMQLQYDYAKRP